MSIEQSEKNYFENQEAILELVQLEGGEPALRNAGSESAPLVTIQFNEELKELLWPDNRRCSADGVLLYTAYWKNKRASGKEVVDEKPPVLHFCRQRKTHWTRVFVSVFVP